jgi:sigma-B regulation protein RsbU (phosphoserine phosphatase)
MYFIGLAPLVSALILLRLCKRVGARACFSTRRVTNLKKYPAVSKFGLVDRQEYRGEEMATDAVVMEPAGEWVASFEVQQPFLQHPEPGIDSLDYSGQCRQVGEVGGDFYNFVTIPGNRLAVAIGDACGKGFPAALMISNVQSSLRTATLFAGANLAIALQTVNRQVYGSCLASGYATLFYGVVDETTRTLHYINAGHNPPMVIRPDGSIIWLTTGGAPVGMFPDAIYEEGSVQLGSGDLILAYTDGVIESLSPSHCEWGTEGLRVAAAESEAGSAGEMVEAIMQSMDRFSDSRQTDDATVAVIRVH